jgi:hypothetical protein
MLNDPRALHGLCRTVFSGSNHRHGGAAACPQAPECATNPFKSAKLLGVSPNGWSDKRLARIRGLLRVLLALSPLGARPIRMEAWGAPE